MPVETLVEAPEYTREGVPGEALWELQNVDLSGVPDVKEPAAALLRLLGSPNVTSKRWIYRQYDQSVLSNTVVQAGADAAVLRIKGTGKGIAVTTDCNGRYCHIDPYTGAAIAVAEAARNVVCAGALPVAVTDCLNFGNPERPEVYYNMEAAIHGIADACRVLSTPVISGNVSLYNETSGGAVYPTPVIGMLGILDDVSRYAQMGFADEGDEVFLLGSQVEQPVGSLGGSEYLRMEHGLQGGRISLDLALEERVQRAALATIRQGIATACHDCSDGGLAVALAEMCLAGNKGLDAGAALLGPRLDSTLFGEAQSRIIITMKAESRSALQTIVGALSVPIELIGRVGPAEAGFRLGPVEASLAELRDAYEGGLTVALARTPPTDLGEVL